MKISSGTDTGKDCRRKEGILLSDKHIGLFIAAHGIGGHPAEEVASEMAINSLAASLKKYLLRGCEHSAAIKHSISKANEAIFAKSEESYYYHGMGATLALAALDGNKAYVASVGDGGAYLVRDSDIKQLTDNHGSDGEFAEMGMYTQEKLLRYTLGNVATRAIGVKKDLAIAVKSLDLKEGDYLMLCTVGLMDIVSDREIKDILLTGGKTLDSKCETLNGLANERTGKSNLPFVLIFWGEED